MTTRNVLFISSSGKLWPWQRQLPAGNLVWGNTQYTIDEAPEGVSDWLVVFDGWSSSDLFTDLPRERRILITGEPESFHRYQSSFLDQFGCVLTPQRSIQHAGVILSQPAINWFAGVRFNMAGKPHTSLLSFDELAASNPPKTRLCSVVCSTKAVTSGHRQRLAFVKMLKEALGDQVDVFGRGFQEVADKDEALASYRFHIALENSSHPDYWTEKLADPFLRGCFPIYAGCPNLSDYFPEGSYARIDISRPSQAIERITNILDSGLDQQRVTELAEAKRRVLWEHNVFALLERTYQRLEQANVQIERLPARTRLVTDREAKDARLSRRFQRYLHRLFFEKNDSKE